MSTNFTKADLISLNLTTSHQISLNLTKSQHISQKLNARVGLLVGQYYGACVFFFKKKCYKVYFVGLSANLIK